MSTLKVISVPPEFLPMMDQEEGYAVVLGDGVLPCHYLGRYATAELADAACCNFADHYGLVAYRINTPGVRRG